MLTSIAARDCIVASSATNVAKKFRTIARTWGELKPEISNQGLSLSNVEAILNPGKLTLSRDESELPEGPFKVYLVPTKNKAGVNEHDAQSIGNALTQAIIKAANLATTERLNELKDELIEKVEEFFDVDLNEPRSDLDFDYEVEEDTNPDVEEARRLSNW